MQHVREEASAILFLGKNAASSAINVFELINCLASDLRTPCSPACQGPCQWPVSQIVSMSPPLQSGLGIGAFPNRTPLMISQRQATRSLRKNSLRTFT